MGTVKQQMNKVHSKKTKHRVPKERIDARVNRKSAGRSQKLLHVRDQIEKSEDMLRKVDTMQKMPRIKGGMPKSRTPKK